MSIFDNSRLVKAVQDKNVDDVVRLLDGVAPGEVTLEHDSTLLHLICRISRPSQKDYENCIPIIKALIEKGADVNAVDDSGGTPLHIAAYFGCAAGVELLLENRAELDVKDKWGKTPLHKAAYKHDFEIASLLLLKGATVNAVNNDGETPADTIANYNHRIASELKDKMKELFAKYDTV